MASSRSASLSITEKSWPWLKLEKERNNTTKEIIIKKTFLHGILQDLFFDMRW
jgi:hypothetical protein